MKIRVSFLVQDTAAVVNVSAVSYLLSKFSENKLTSDNHNTIMILYWRDFVILGCVKLSLGNIIRIGWATI